MKDLEIGDLAIGEDKLLIKIAAIEFGKDGRAAMIDRFSLIEKKWIPVKAKIQIDTDEKELYLVIRE